ncbi:MAG TPA: hypothetical protein VHL14_06710 [Steroidobacteraceae bacterium]|nr:hypothetical protein [Steroidobacteraceae bacterium]
MQNRHYRIAIGIIILLAALLAFWLNSMNGDHSSHASTPSSTRRLHTTDDEPVASYDARTAKSSLSAPIPGNFKIAGREICGIGVFESIPADADEIDRKINEETQKAWQLLKNSLLSSDDVAARAAGLILSISSPSNLKDGFDRDSLNELVQLASNSTNAAAYGLAYQVCGRVSSTSLREVCRPINARRWAEIDPGNAAPLLELAGQQEATGDIAGATHTLIGASTASRIDAYGDTLSSKAEWLAPKEMPPLSQVQLEMGLLAFQSAWSGDYLKRISYFCLREKSSVANDVTRDVCGKIGELMVNSRNLIDLSFSRSLGRHLGWPKYRIDQITDDVEAIQAESASVFPKSFDCNSIEKTRAYFRLRAELGERGATQFMIDHSGTSIGDLAKQYRDSSK